MPFNPDLINEILDEILACACDSLDSGVCDSEPSLCLCPCRKFVSAGPPTAENCCEDGQLTVHSEELFAYERFPSRTISPVNCSVQLAIPIVITLFRCFPTTGDDGVAPTPAQIISATELIHRDLYLITKGVICCLTPRKKTREYVFNGGRILNPSGGCVGAEAKFIVQLV